MLESEALSALSQVVCEAAMDLCGRSDPKTLVAVVSRHGQSCCLVRFDQSSFKKQALEMGVQQNHVSDGG